MKELLEYRASLIDRLEAAANEFCTACLAVKDAYQPPIAGAWNVHQIAVHVRDVDLLVYGARARRTVDEEHPEFQNFDGDAYMAEHYLAAEPLKRVLDALQENVRSLAEMLRELPTEAWARESQHVTLGHGFTVQTWVERDLAHIEEHIENVKSDRRL